MCAEGRLVLEFVCDDYMRIKTWNMSVRQHRELIPKSLVAMHANIQQQQPDLAMLDQISTSVTRNGITISTLNYLRVSGDIFLC